jgi:hypothetical protein
MRLDDAPEASAVRAAHKLPTPHSNKRKKASFSHGCKALPAQPMMFVKEEPLDDHHHYCF